MPQLEAEVLRELRAVTGLRKLRQKDIMEWSTGEITAQGAEKVVHLPALHINVAYLEPLSHG